MVKNIDLSRVDSCKYLGIIIDRNLSWKEHIDYVYKKVIKFISISHKICTKMNDEILKMLYFAFVFPHLLYGIEIYNNTYQSHLSELVKLNNKTLRILQNAPLKSLTLSLYKNYNILPIPLLHDFQILVFVHKFLYHGNKMLSIFASYFTQIHLYTITIREQNTAYIYITHTLIVYSNEQLYLCVLKGMACSRLGAEESGFCTMATSDNRYLSPIAVVIKVFQTEHYGTHLTFNICISSLCIG